MISERDRCVAGLKRRRRLDPESRRRLHRPDEEPSDQIVGEGTVAVESTADRFRDAFVEAGRYRRAVTLRWSMHSATDHDAGRRAPGELFLGERRDERIGFGGQAFELLPVLVDLGRQRKMTGASHDSIVTAGGAYNPRAVHRTA